MAAAPEAPERRSASSPASPGPVRDAEPRHPLARRAVIVTRRPRPWRPRVLDEVRRARAPARPGRRARRPVPRRRRSRPRRLRASSSSRTASLGGGGLLAGEREQVVGEPREPVGVVPRSSTQLGRGAVAGEVGDVAAQRGQRRAQLVRRVGEEAALGVARALEAASIRVQRRGEPGDLVARSGFGQPAARVAGALDLARGVGEPCQRPSARRISRAGAIAPRAAAMSAAQSTNARTAASVVCDVVGRRGDDHGAAGRRRRRHRERRDVDARSVAAELAVRVAAAARGDRAPHARVRGQRPARRARATGRRSGRGGRATSTRGCVAAERGVERAGRGQERGRRGAQLGDLDGAALAASCRAT